MDHRSSPVRMSGRLRTAFPLAADKTKETRKMSAMSHFCRQTKPKKTEKCLPCPTSAGRQNQRKQKNICHVPLLPADKTKETRKMSARFNFCRQTKPKKPEKCLPCPTYVGRQNQRKQKNVCRVPFLTADKTKENRKISAMSHF